MTRSAPGRLLDRLDQLYAIGGGPGANRVAGSAEEDEAHRLATAWLEQAGLEVEVDGAGNLLGRAAYHTDLWTGSHLDSVPRGGRFDGALGVVAAIEAVERTGAGCVVVFRGEEVGCIGSRALVASGRALPRAFLEVHVEQGPVLAGAEAPLGVATGIVGYARGEVVVTGRAGHAGTTPMAGRDDALVEAAREILRIREAALATPGAVATVGRVEVEPGAVNVIPGRVRLGVDVRCGDADRLARLMAEVGIGDVTPVPPVEFAGAPRQALADELAARGLPLVELPSGAGHDAGVLAGAGVPSAMLLVRSLSGGVSHSPDEESSPDDVALAVDVLAGALARLAESAS